MNEPENSIRGELAALVLLSLGGFLFHFQIHPIPLPGAPSDADNFIPFALGLAGIFISPVLLSRRGTWLAGYLVNGFSVVVGTVLMGSLMVSGWKGAPSPGDLLSDGMLPTILLAFPKLMIGQRILHHYRPGGTGRMFTPMWWARHFIYASLLFAAGRLAGG